MTASSPASMTGACPCGSGKTFSECCEPFIKGTKNPITAEELMRSRYTAFAVGEISYLRSSLAPEEQKGFDMKSTQEWSKKSKWLGLEIMSVKKGGPSDKTGTVEFMAKYAIDGKNLDHHEVSQFRKSADGKWYFVDGDSHTHEEGQGHHDHSHGNHDPVVREEPKVGRNDACPCGSGKKYKKCCGAAA
jgi:SEC-C motif-containing protein